MTPYPHLLEVLLLDGDGYRIRKVYRKQDTLTSPTLPGLELPLAAIFDFPVSDEERIAEVHETMPPYPRVVRPDHPTISQPKSAELAVP